MAKTLDVYLHSQLAGQLIQDDHGDMVFDYAESWLINPGAIPLSHSLPLRKERFKRNECRGFFGGILPEESKRELVARNLGISARNDFAMLEQIGGECAGAVTFIPTGELLPQADYKYRPLDDQELERILKELPRRPLMAGEDGVRLSLAGAQDKIAVHVSGDQISIPLDGAPSTHILKPAVAHFEGVVFNEALCMNLAAATDMVTSSVDIRSVGNIDYLLVRRYDRNITEVPVSLKPIRRMHQEDFCQALAIPSDHKYQAEGGPSFKDCFDLIRDSSSVPVIDLQRFLDALIFNFIVGNCDAHGKNFSFTYDHDLVPGFGLHISLAPLYDIVCTAYYPEISRKMAMKIGGEYQVDQVYPRHFDKLADECGLAKPLVKKRVAEIAESIANNVSQIDIDHPVADGVKALIQARSHSVLEDFKD